MKKMFVGFTAVFVLLFFSFAAEAGAISIRNSTGVEIYYLYISSSGNNDWEEDVLGNDTFENGKTLRVNVTGSYRMFDLRAEDGDGDYLEWYEFPGNVTQITLKSDGTAEYQ